MSRLNSSPHDHWADMGLDDEKPAPRFDPVTGARLTKAKTMKPKSDYDTGCTDGYCGLEHRYPNNVNYVLGYASGVMRAQGESVERDSYEGSNDMHADALGA